MNTILIYNSRTGFTKQYATWLKDALHCQTVAFKDASTMDLRGYDTVIFASYFYAGAISKLKWFKAQTNPHRIVFAVGACPAQDTGIQNAIEQNFKDDLNAFTVFYAQRGLCYEKMYSIDRFLMFFRRQYAKKTFGANSPASIGISSSFDASSKHALAPLINHIQSLNAK